LEEKRYTIAKSKILQELKKSLKYIEETGFGKIELFINEDRDYCDVVISRKKRLTI